MATPASGIPLGIPGGTGNGALDSYVQASQNAISNGVNYQANPTYGQLASLLGPGPNGGLNSNLMAQYNQGAQIIGQNTGANEAQAMSTAQGNGLGGSTIAAQGVENAQFGGQMADSSLMASLYGQQNQNTSQLASDLFSGSQSDLSSLLSLYDSAGTSAANMAMYGEGLTAAMQQAQQSDQDMMSASKMSAETSIGTSVIGGASKVAAASASG